MSVLLESYLKHNGVDLFSNFLIGKDDAFLTSFDQEIKKSLSLLLTNVIINI